MQIKTDYLVTSPSRWEALAPYSMNPTEITFHNTYNDASALNEVKNVYNNSKGTSFHTAVDDKEVQQVIPFNRNAWHSGDGGSGAGNRKSIGVEICYSMSGGTRYRKAELNAIEHISDLMVKFNIPISKVKTHQERNGKYCPHRMLDEGRVQWFKQQCEKRANEKRNGNDNSKGVIHVPLLQTGAFGRNETPDVAGAATSLNMTGKFILKGDGMLYFVSDPTSDAQLKSFKEYLDRKGWWYEVK
ncbi:N-acetylmuramoyl-L-alanine amidase [Bacillus phage PSYJ-YH]|nr:N-acetylmuramoyl-L-alanine amidase [Bacillus phage PSYJ-YH]